MYTTILTPSPPPVRSIAERVIPPRRGKRSPGLCLSQPTGSEHSYSKIEHSYPTDATNSDCPAWMRHQNTSFLKCSRRLLVKAECCQHDGSESPKRHQRPPSRAFRSCG